MNPASPILWIDPGKDTGLALWTPADGYWGGEWPFMEAGNRVEQICAWFRHELRAGWEHFHVTPTTPGDDAHHAIEMIGVCRRAVMKNGCTRLGPAQPGQRLIATQKMLERIGWWRPGEDDAQSAAQHLLAYMLRTGQVPARESVALGELREKMDDDGFGQARPRR